MVVEVKEQSDGVLHTSLITRRPAQNLEELILGRRLPRCAQAGEQLGMELLFELVLLAPPSFWLGEAGKRFWANPE